MLDLELLRMMDETQLINYVESYGSEESIAVMNAILKLGKLENEAGISIDTVLMMADLLCESEDFDGLVSMIDIGIIELWL